MYLKLLLFFLVAVTTTIEAHHFFKNLHHLDLSRPFSSKTTQKTLDTLVRKRRDVESTDSSEEIPFSNFLVAAAWQGNKKELLAGFLEEMSDSDSNLTVIGWQRILDEEGKIKEIRSVQLVIPPKPDEDRPHNIVDDDDDDDDDSNERVLPYDDIKEMREVFEPLASAGIPLGVTMEEFDEEGKQKTVIYLDKDELYFSDGQFSVYNKTTVASPQEVSDFVSSLKPKALGKPSVLKYDVDGKLLVDQSHIRPHILGSVNDHFEAPDNILTEAPQIIAQISQQYNQSEVPKQLAIHYNKAYPEYKWRVLVDPDTYFLTRDVEIDLTYDNFDLDENSLTRFLVYGRKVNTVVK